jgi:SAM-dependent methyltransferase
LYFIEDGKVSYAGREPERILISLMGGSPNVQALREFVDLPELFANARFAAECLAIPGIVAEANSADPQLSLIGAALSTLDAGTPTRILDFGAGAGRLVEALAAIHGETLKLCLDYVAWDNSRNAEATCRAAIKRGYDSADDRWFTDRNALFGRWNVGSFQYVVMCNVLHEIDPKDWLTVFAADSILVRTLAPTGKLVVVEDYLMPKGEYAHPYGFIVLNTEALQALFCAGVGEDEVTVREADNKFSGRIRAHLVPAHLLTRVNGESRKKALELARCNARDEIQRLRRSNQHDFRSGQAHAFWVQQFANTSLALADL